MFSRLLVMTVIISLTVQVTPEEHEVPPWLVLMRKAMLHPSSPMLIMADMSLSWLVESVTTNSHSLSGPSNLLDLA